jgi:4-diphosphocytidyl-2-C-methyl-D-erythritol kinase
MGAGLGGGSADAAAALLLLDRLWRTGLGARGLRGIAADLGSDVPFFLHGGLALGIGRGEEVIPLPDVPELPLVVVTPTIQVPTSAVYARLGDDDPWCRPLASVYDFYTGLTNELPWSSVRNDLQSAVITGWPEVGEALAGLESTAPRHAAVTGSGAAVFAIYGDVGSARRASAKLADRWWVHVGVTMSRDAARPRPDVTDRATTGP